MRECFATLRIPTTRTLCAINVKPRNKKLLEGIFFLLLGLCLATYSVYDSIDGSFIAGSKYGLSSTLSISDGSSGYWLAVGFRVFLGALGIVLGLLAIKDFKQSKNPYD